MELFEVLEFLLIMSIPVVGGFFLYNDIRWNMFSKNSVLYGCVYAFIVCAMLVVNGRYGFMFAGCNKIQYGLDSCTYARCIDGTDPDMVISAVRDKAIKSGHCTIKNIFAEHYRGHKVLVCVYSGRLLDVIENMAKYSIKNEMTFTSREK